MRAPRAWPASSTTLYQAKVRVRPRSSERSGSRACSSENAAPRSRPIPFTIPNAAAGASIQARGARANPTVPVADRSARTIRQRVRPRRSAYRVTTRVPRATPRSPDEITTPTPAAGRPSPAA